MTEEQLYKLNFFLLLEIRQLSRKSCPEIYDLVNSLHNLPMQLQALQQGSVPLLEIEADIRARLKSAGLEGWLENHLEHNL